MAESQCTVTVHYFEGHGLAERTRWMLAAGDIAFKNSPVTSRAAFLKLRDEEKVLPFGQLPLVEIDDMKLSQSLPCAMYVARKANLVPSDPAQMAQLEMLISAICDFATAGLSPPFRVHRDGCDIAEAQAAGMLSMQRTLPYVEAFAAKNAQTNADSGASGKFLVGAKRSAADVLLAQALYEAAEACKGAGTQLQWLQEACPHLHAVVQDVIAQPNVAAYLASDLRYPPSGPAYVQQVDEVLGRK